MPRSEVFVREEVLDSAKNLFWIKGYNGTSMQDLVDATGLNRSSIYNSFGSKMELYEMTLLKYKEEGKKFRNKAVEQNKNAIETIGLLFLYAMNDILNDADNKGCMLINCNTELGNQHKDLHRILKGNQEQFVEFFDAIVTRGQREGSIRKDDQSIVIAHYLVSAFQGFRITGMNIKDEVILKGIIHNILKSIA